MRTLLLLSLALIASDAWACGCDKPRTVKEVRSFTHIFKGRVMSVEQLPGREGVEHQIVHFAVLELIKGKKATEIPVEFWRGATSCDLEPLTFAPGQIYLLSTLRTGDGSKPKDTAEHQVYENNFCSLREHLGEKGK